MFQWSLATGRFESAQPNLQTKLVADFIVLYYKANIKDKKSPLSEKKFKDL